MALITSHVWATVNGSIGGITYGNSKYGITARNRTKPIDPNTANQQKSKNGLSYGSSNWNLLDQADRDGWNAYASTITKTSKSGVVYTPSGREMYIAYYSLTRYLYEQGHISEGPNDRVPTVPGVLVDPTIQTAGPSTPASTGIEIQISNNLAESSLEVYVQIGNIVSGGRVSYRGPWYAISALQDSVDAQSSKTFEFLGYAVGDRIPYRVRGFVTVPTFGEAGKLTRVFSGIAVAEAAGV